MEEVHEHLLSDFTREERFLLKKALSRLSVYDDTPRALCDRLCKLAYKKEPVSRESAVKVVRFLHAQGLINERTYAENLLSALISRGYGTRRILSEFYARKFSEKTIARIREELSEAEDEENLRAFEMLSRRVCVRKSDLSDPKEKQRLYGYLARLGFGSEAFGFAWKKLTEKEEL